MTWSYPTASALSRRRLLDAGRGRRRRRARGSVAAAGGGGAQARRHPGQRPADADRVAGFRRRSRPHDPAAGRNVTQIITANLQRSGLFAPIDPAAYIEKIIDHRHAAALSRLAADQRPGAGHRPHARQADGRLKAEFRLWDVFAGQQLRGQQYFTTADNWRRIAHIISDAIYERLTGEKGYFDTRIVFVDESGPKERRDQAARDHGSGRRQRALSHARRRPRADAALLAVDAGRSPTCPTGRAIRASICSTSRPASARSSAISPA